MNSKMIGLIFLLLTLLVFALQNTQTVAIKFLFWEVTTSAVLTILISFALGVLSGWLIRFVKPPLKI